MNSTIINSLLILQNIDRDILSIQKKLSFIPKSVKEIEDKLKIHHEKSIEKKNELDLLLKKRKEFELEMQSQNDKLKKLEVQLFTLKNNKEYAAMLKEINDIKKNNEKIEESILEIMYQYDKEKEAHKIIENEVKEFEALNQKEKEEKKKEEEILREDLKEKNKIRGSHSITVNKNTVSIYEKILKNKNDFAVVEVKSEVCQGCHMRVPPQMINDLILSEELFFCPHCARIIYLETREHLFKKNSK